LAAALCLLQKPTLAALTAVRVLDTAHV